MTDDGQFHDVTIENNLLVENDATIKNQLILKASPDNYITLETITSTEPENVILEISKGLRLMDIFASNNFVEIQAKKIGDDSVFLEISKGIRLPCDNVQVLNRQELVNFVWSFDNGLWLPANLTIPIGNNYVRFRDTTAGHNDHFGDLALVSINDEFSSYEPILTWSQGMVVKKDFSAGGFVTANQGLIALGSGMYGSQFDPPGIWLLHSGKIALHDIDTLSSPPSAQLYRYYINSGDSHLYQCDQVTPTPHWADKGHISSYNYFMDTCYVRRFPYSVILNPEHRDTPPGSPSYYQYYYNNSDGHIKRWNDQEWVDMGPFVPNAPIQPYDQGHLACHDLHTANVYPQTTQTGGLGEPEHVWQGAMVQTVYTEAIKHLDGTDWSLGGSSGATFVIRKQGSYYEAIDASGGIAFGGANANGGVSGTYATPVIKAAINALTPDRDYLQWIKFVGHITLTKDGANDYCVKIAKLTGLDLTAASLTLENSQNCDMIRIESTGNPQEHSWIKGGIIEGNKTNNTTGDGIKVWNGSHNILEEITVRNCAGHGIRLTGDAAAWAGLHRVLDCRSYFNGGCGFVTNNQSDDFFLNCISQSNLSYGFWLLYPQQLYRCHSIYNAAGFNIQSHCHLVECYADTNHRSGFYADSAVGTVYQLWFNNCYAYRNSQEATNTYDGFHIENINDVQFVNCRSKPSITDPDGANQRYGYYINGCDNVSFSNCMAQYNDNHGFFISNSEYSSVTGCQSRQNKGHGYRLENTVGCAVTGCIGTSNTMNGLSAYICADLSITGGSYNYNSVGTTTYHGVSLNGDSNNCAINGVTARENGGYQFAILAAACDNCIIEGCTASVSTVGSISNSGTNCIVRNNRGYITELSGTITMASGNNYIEVPYLLGDTLHRLTAPSGNIHWTFRNVPLTELGDTWVQNVDNDSFTIRVRNAPNVDVSIGWEIRL